MVMDEDGEAGFCCQDRKHEGVLRAEDAETPGQQAILYHRGKWPPMRSQPGYKERVVRGQLAKARIGR